MKTRKVLISHGFGAGWSSWADKEIAQMLAEYKPIIDFLETGGKAIDLTDTHPIMVQLEKELEGYHFYNGGLHKVVVVETTLPYRIEEYDGNEYIITPDKGAWFF